MCYAFAKAQTTTITRQNTLIKEGHNFGLTNPVFDENSPMTYDPSKVDKKGAAFSITYNNQGGTSFDGYPSGTVGGFKANNSYEPGNVETCGMPVKIKDLTDELRINWKTSQRNANDIDDKWWATINVIFDGGTATSQPDPEARDYDLVIQNVSYEQDDFKDLDNPGGRYWYFARETPDGEIKKFTLYINDVAYSWAVRYKFFDYDENHPDVDKNDKVHIKFIPIDNSNPIPFFDHSLKQFIDCTRDYIQYLPLSPEEEILAKEKVAEEELWIKSLSAGYEVYEGSSILANNYFYTTIDRTPPAAVGNLSVANAPNFTAALEWEASQDNAFSTYTIYRADNGDSNFNIIATDVRTNSFVDTTVNEDGTYEYYVTVTDRSFNESEASNKAALDVLSSGINELVDDLKVYPNPTRSLLNIDLSNPDLIDGKIEIYDSLGRRIIDKRIANSTMSVNLEGAAGIYILRVLNHDSITSKKIILN
ncbi:hypothetical protein AAU57_08465 [Nonlabens sp. YIK11]|nr:hypothetical protein AAU57_08465 [Nonlabens sp. YIK11]